ncbi:hypothetical protein T459_27542 [Capsicum annuum]|uniref:Replication factor A C-terminal domain-containing protein n=1 Tax=Capsicum annuum TaxID=4072 RepID=A0A2G2YE90_CAPAN|nr:hypothetical protein T459_27542 [Capsicum annuum]
MLTYFYKHRYKIHIQMKDNTDKTTFVLFNDVAEKFLDTPAHKLFNKISSLDNNDVPAHIQSLYGKDFIFNLKLNSYNLKKGLENFTISTFWIPDENLELGYKLKEEKKVLQYSLLKFVMHKFIYVVNHLFRCCFYM